MFEAHPDAVLDFLRAERLAGEEQVRELQAAHQETGQSVASLAIGRGLIGKAELLARLAAHLGLDYAGSEVPEPSTEALALLPPDLAHRYGVLPLRVRPGGLDLLMADPFHGDAATDLGFALDREIRLIVDDPDRVRTLLREHYGPHEGRVEESARASYSDPPAGPHPPEISEAELEALAAQAPVIRFVNTVLRQAVLRRASDIHFEPFEAEFKIRYRIDGALREMPPPPRHLALPITSRLKVLADLNIAERRLPQDGRITFQAAGRPVDLRVSTLPTQFGESAVLRVLDRSHRHLELAHLGLPPEVRTGIEEVIRRPHGIFVVTGPTGSGKTTTLYSALRVLNQVGRKLLTVEDPVEYEIEGVMQVAVNPGAGLTFASALRAFLRQDPDVIMVGEIRDADTAQLAVQAALTGHLVLSTLHTADAAGAVDRLIDLGVEPFLLASTLEGVLAQRLVRRICSQCRTLAEPPKALLRRVALAPHPLAGQPCFAGAGCVHCGQTGYDGRVGLFEWLPVTASVKEDIAQRAPALRIRQRAMEQGMRALRDEGMRAVSAGVTTPEEVARCC